MSSTELDTRSRILAKSLQLLVERQGKGVRIQDIAQAAGVSRQAVYLHFPSRVDLLIATARYADDLYGEVERFRQNCEASSGVELLEAYVDFWANYIPEIYGLAKALLAAQETDKAAAAAWQDRMNALRGGCEDVIQRLSEEQTLAPEWTPSEAIDFMWTMLLLPNWENLTMHCGWTNEQYASWIKTTLKKILVREECL